MNGPSLHRLLHRLFLQHEALPAVKAPTSRCFLVMLWGWLGRSVGNEWKGVALRAREQGDGNAMD